MPEITSPLENVSATIFCARVAACRCASIAVSMRSAVRPSTAYARTTGAPTTASEIAPSISPTRSRTRVYAPATSFWKWRSRMNSGRKQAHTSSVSCHE